MARTCPYLQRRGETYFFRIHVPKALRRVVGTREITKSLSTRDRRAAQPVALQLGAIATRLFHNLQAPGMSKEQTLKLLEQARQQLKLNELKEQHDEALVQQRVEHVKELREARLEAELEAYRKLLQSRPDLATFPAPEAARDLVHLPHTIAENAANRLTASVPTLGRIIDEFLAEPDQKNKPQMLKKHQAVLGLFKSIAGDKPINVVRQSDVKAFFNLVGRLPTRWTFECARRKISPAELAEEEHDMLLGPKTFEGTYIASMKVFLKYAVSTWQDQGLPATLTTDGIKYQGGRKKGENMQRAFKPNELERLFGGAELRHYRQAPDQEHKFWLPAIGLYTGARVNEICQLNPQTDICRDPEHGIWHFWITEETAADERVQKSTKNQSSRRRVPIHSKLIELGLLTYVQRMKTLGAKILFPAWKPVRGRASHDAEEWFRDLLVEIELRDETPGKRLVGMHAFRSTLMARASNSEPPVDASPLTGHSGTKTRVIRGYEGELDLDKKRKLLEAIDFKFDILSALNKAQRSDPPG